MTIEAMKQALEALEEYGTATTYAGDDDEVGAKVCCGELSYKPHSLHCPVLKAITSLRQAIEQAQKQEPVECQYGNDGYACCEGGPCKAEEHNEALAQQAQKQKPVAVVTGTYAGHFVVTPTNPAMVLPVGMAFYSAPQQAEKQKAWVEVECPLCGEMAVANTHPNLPKRERVVFPTMLRKMWSGGEVQAWLDENVNKEKNT